MSSWPVCEGTETGSLGGNQNLPATQKTERQEKKFSSDFFFLSESLLQLDLFGFIFFFGTPFRMCAFLFFIF